MLYQRTMRFCTLSQSDIRGKYPIIHLFYQLCPLYKQLLANMEPTWWVHSTILQSFHHWDKNTKCLPVLLISFRRDLFSIVEFKNITFTTVCWKLFFLAYISELQLNFSLSYFNFSLSLQISSSYLLFFVFSLFLAFLPAAGLWLEGMDAAAPPFSHSSLMWFSWGKTSFKKYYSTIKCFCPPQIRCLKACQ